VSVRSKVWDCPPLNLINWNMAWMWKAPVQGFANTDQIAKFVWDVGEQNQRLPIGYVYQMTKKNR